MKGRLHGFWGGLGALALLAVPFLALLPLGFAWLWQSGLLLAWLVGAGAMAGLAVLAWRRWRRADTGMPAAPPPDPAWSPRDEAAWAEVQRLAAAADGAVVTDAQALTDLARAVVEAVARHYHPDNPRAAFAFTLPEACLLAERVSRDMRHLLREAIPFSDRVTVQQVMRASDLRHYVDHARKARDAWRAIRAVANPLAAAAAEIRERLTGQVVDAVVDVALSKIARIFVQQVGRAAIDLYGGRLRLSDAEADAAARAGAAAPAEAPPPLRILIGGQVNAGKSSLVNALAAEVRAAVDVLPATRVFTPHAIGRDGLPAAVLLDGPGFAAEADMAPLLAEADSCDLVAWVVAADRPARELDRRAIARFQQHFTERPSRRRPPMILVLSHVDRLRPFNEWSPPYDLDKADTPKAAAIREATLAACGDLGFDPADAVPACLAAEARYNVEAVWARIAQAVPEARQAQLNRVLAAAGGDWGRVWTQLRGAGRVLGRVMRA